MFIRFFTSFILSLTLLHAADWRQMFPGFEAAARPGNEWTIENFIYTIENPGWNGEIRLEYDRLHNLNEEQLERLAMRIQESCGGILRFSTPIQREQTNSYNYTSRWEEFHLEDVILTIDTPFGNAGAERAIFESNWAQQMVQGAARRTQILDMSLGQIWSALKAFIEHYQRGLNEVEYLLSQISQDERIHIRNAHENIERKVAAASALFAQLSKLYEQINQEFDKPARTRHATQMQSNLDTLMTLLNGQEMGQFLREEGRTNIFTIRNFVATQPALAKFRALQACKYSTMTPEATPTQETTAQMLDRLLTGKPQKDIGEAVAHAEPGLIKTLRLAYASS